MPSPRSADPSADEASVHADQVIGAASFESRASAAPARDGRLSWRWRRHRTRRRSRPTWQGRRPLGATHPPAASATPRAHCRATSTARAGHASAASRAVSAAAILRRMTPSEFAAKWAGSTRTERAAAQEHFIDLCRMLGVPTPNEADPTGDWYAFEKGAGKAAGGDGFADVWKRGHFAWEYKGKRKDLAAGLPAAPAVPRGAREPAAARRLRPRPLRGPHQLHEHADAAPPLHLATCSPSPAEPLRILARVMQRSGGAAPRQTPRS